ncbi:filamentous hemagglutinin family protein [Janthinobacterium sp. 35]|uniref:YDG domain-containing protein n=1 Tax=Janthinobacterium sp. 35 TaxID=2035210 RepID=UPI000C1A54BD|nr:YDG domain-containing protein [Janthinobacterium sp. 35]PIG30274.1 filamentous hemagglutinin family protein [Janthinobacterium sp. 35]
MNRIYRSIWNQATGAYAAVSENVKSAGKRSMPGCSGGGAHFALTSMAAALMLGYGSLALAGPAGGTVVAGQATINGAPGATVINQGSQNAVINWANFNINKGESVQFVQPNSNAVALNRVLGSDGTTILGNLSANGKVFIVNPNGVLFGQGASVNTAGLVASTLDISNADFMAGKYQFSGNGTGKVLNQGSISAPGGYVALLGANVSNEGTIQARLGSVALAAGRAITLDVAGDGLLNVAVNAGAVGALVSNGGMIKADGGSVVLTAQAAGDLLKTVVNNTGVIEAQTIDTRSGTIKLLGDMQSGTVNAAGTLDASAPAGGKGGFIDTSAAHVNIAKGINVTTKAANGLSGTWLIDPVDFTIAASGGNMTGTDLMIGLSNGSVQIQSTDGTGGTAGDVNVNEAIAWSANKLTLTAQNNININKPMTGTGTASLALEYGQSTVASSNAAHITIKAEVNLPSGNSFSTKQGSDGTTKIYTMITSLGAAGSVTGTDLQGMRNLMSGNYALGANIDASATSTWGANGFIAIGTNTTPFTGQFEGLGHVITGLTSNTSTSNVSAALFGTITTAAQIRNVGLLNVNLSSSVPGSGSYGNVAGVVGSNSGLINNAYVSGSLSTPGYAYIGGLVGKNSGTILNSGSSATISVTNATLDTVIGGLVGLGTKASKITGSYNTGAVTATAKHTGGGLVGINYGAITNSFNTGAVAVGIDAGGLVASNRGSTAVINNSFSTGAVSANGHVGGLVGWTTSSAQINNSYATGTVTGLGLGGLASASVSTGGLVGNNRSSISNSYATGDVTGATSSVGGVVGANGTSTAGASVTNVYSSGKVTLTGTVAGTTVAGGVIGFNNATATITGGYFNSTVNLGSAIGDGTGSKTKVKGLSATEMRTGASFDNFSFTTTTSQSGNNWVMVNTDGTLNNAGGALGATGPMLSSEYSTTIKSPHQLQLMAMNLAGNYTLARDLNLAATGTTGDVWNGATFVPVGTSTAAPFTGTFDGAAHVISGLVLNRPGIDSTGLFGATSSTAVIRDVGLDGGSVNGATDTATLVGNNAGTISGSYSTMSVTGTANTGGLVGNNSGTVSNSYATGAVNGTNTVGGLVGVNSGALTNNYANGAVTGSSNTGGLAGASTGSATGNFWDTATSGQATSAAGTGLTTTQMKSPASYTAATWDLAGTWIIYDTYTYPLLRAFMTPLQVNFAANNSKTYDGTSTFTATGVTANRSGAYASLLGTLSASAAGNAVNVGTYAITAGGLYSGQRGYIISYGAGTVTIDKRAVTVSGMTASAKVYDGNATASLTGGTLSGLVAGETVSFSGQAGAFVDKNAGTGKSVTVSGITLADGANLASNYSVTNPTDVTGDITPKALTVTGATAGNKVYDGNTKATVSGGALSGLVGSETLGLSGLSGVFADKNAATGKVLTISATLADGTGLASNYTVNNPTGVTADITQATINTVSNIVAASKEYDGATSATVSNAGATFAGMVNGDVLNVSATSANFIDKNAGSGKVVNASGLTLGGTDAANYNLTAGSGSGSGAITPKALTVSGAVAGNKTYDGSTAAAVTGGTLSGMINGESLNLGALSGAFADQNAGTSKAVTVSGGTLSDGANGGLASNYTLASVTGLTADIAQKALTVSGVSVASKSYDGNTKATISGGTLNGLVIGETLTLSGQSGAFNDQNAGNGKAVTVTGATLGNGSGLASNYTVSNATGATGNITQKALTVTGATAADKVYDGGTAATVNGGTLDGLVSGETLGLSSLIGVFGDKNAGASKTVTVTGGALSDGTNGGLASNYTVGAVTGVTASITQKALTVSGLAASAKAYDGNTKASLTGGTLNGLVVGETVSFSGQSGVFADKNAGTGKVVTVTGTTLVDGSGLASNYSLANPTGVTGDITKKALTITGITATNRAYTGGTAVSLGGTVILDGLVGAEGVGVGGMVGVFLDKNVGTGKAVTITGAVMTVGSNGGLASNYTISNPTGVTANITKATISAVTNIVIDSKVYDAGLNAIVNAAGATFGGIKSGDSLTVNATTATFADKNVGTGKTVNISGIGLGGTDAGNYNLTTTTGSSTGAITPKALTIIGMSAVSKAYDGNTKASVTGGSISGLVGDETLGVTGLTVTFDDKNAGTGKAVTATGTTLVNGGNGGLASNYTMANPTGFTANITPKALTVSGMTAGTRAYDGTRAATLAGGSLSGVISGETLVLSGGTGVFVDKNAGNGKAVTVSGVSLLDGTGLASNYSVTNPTNVTGSITQKVLSVTGALAADKTYDGALDASITGGSLSGFVGSETVGLASLAGAFADKNAGSGKAVSITGGTLSNGSNGGLASNYSVGPASGLIASITQKALSVTGVAAANKVYDSTTKASVTGGSLSGLVGSETLGLSGLSGVFVDKNAGTGKTVTVSGATLADGTGLASNYTVGNPTDVTANISKSNIGGVSNIVAGSKVYDATDTATVSNAGATFAGMFNGDSLRVSATSANFIDKNAGSGKVVNASGLTLGGTDAGNYNLTATTGTGTGTITQAQIASVSGITAAGKTYDATDAATVSNAGATFAGMVNGDSLNVSATSANFIDKNAGSGKVVNASGLTLGGTDAGNYNLTATTGTGTGTITQAQIASVSGITAAGKTYDATDTAILNAGATYNGMFGGDSLTFTATKAAFSDKNAGTGKTVNVSGIALGGADAGNYTLASDTATGTGDIAKATITGVSSFAAASKTYDGTDTATVSNAGATFAGMVNGDSLNVSATSANFIDKNAGSGKVVNASGLTLGGTDAGNYNLTATTGTGTGSISQAQIASVSGITAAGKTYDGTDTATVSNAGATFAGMFNGDSLNVSATSANFIDKNAGSGKVVNASGLTLGGTDAGNYNLTATTGTGTGAITPKALTITGMSAVSKAYDGNTKASVTGGSISGLVGTETLGVTGLTVTFDDKNAGTGKAVTATGTTLVNGGNGGLASNYMMANPTGFTANITPKALTVSGMTAGTRVYDGTTAATLLGGSLSGVISGETLVLSGGTGVFVDKNAGNGKTVTVSGISLLDGTGLASNYSVTNPTNVTGSITQKVLGVTGALAADKTYDGALDASITGGSLSGFVGSETVGLASLAGAFADKNAGSGKAVSITGGTLSNGSNGGLASNYSVGPASGLIASITQKALSVTGVAAANKVYDSTTKASVTGGSLNGLVGSETLGLSGLSGVFVDKNAGTGKTVTVSGATLADGTGLASNYTLSNPTGVTANISQATISSVTNVVADSKVYDGGTSVTFGSATATFNGMFSGDSLGIGATKAAFSDKNAGAGKGVTISSLTLGGLDAANYTLASTTATGTGSITPKALTITGMSAVNKVYDGSTKATLSGGSISGLVGTETVGVTGLSATFDTRDAGTGKTVTATGSTLVNGGNGGLAANYTISNPTGLIASITPKALTVSGMTAGTRAYDGTTAATLAGGSLTGLITGETLLVSGGTGVFVDKNAGNGKAVTVSGISLLDGTGRASNYTVSNPTGLTASITAKALTVDGQLAGNKVYDGNAEASLSGGALSGLVAGESLGFGGQSAVFSDKNAANGKAVTVTGTTLVDTASGLASNYTVSNPSGLTASITAKALTVAGQLAGNKVYDGNTVASLSGGALSGLVAGESLGIAGQTAVFSDKNAANGKAVTVTGTTLVDTASGLASNYTVSNPSGLTASITPKALTVAGQLAGNKVYDGNTAAQLSGGVLAGLVAGESLGIAGQTALFSDKNAANGKAVTVSGTTLVDTASGLASNYTVSNPTGLTASITAKALTVSGQLAGNKVYDGNAEASLSGGALSGLVAGEALDIAGQTAVFSDKNAANGKAVTVSGTTLVDTASGLASNYTVSNPTGLTASITAKALTVAGQLAGNKVYDGNAEASLSGGALSGLVAGESLGIAGQTAVFSDKNAANGKAVTVTGTTLVDTASGLASNYTVSNPTGLTASITPKALTVAGQLAGNKVYDGNTAAQLSGGVLAGLVAGESLGIAGQTAVFSDKNAANGKAVTVTGTSLVDTITGLASNYTVSDPTGLTASITPASLLVRATGAAPRVYDTTTNASVTLDDNRIAGDVLTISNSGASFADKNAGANKTVTVNGIALGGTDAGNYTVNATATTTASITQAELGVKVGNAEKDQGNVNPAFTASYTGLLGNDTLANEVSGNLAFSTPATIATPSGSYLVSAAGQTSTNYALTYTPGVLTVKPTEARQSAVASVIAAVNVAPSQGNMVQADVVAKGETVTSKEDVVQVVAERGQPQQGSTPVVLTTASVNSNVLPGLRLSVVDTGLRLPVTAGNTSIDSQ